MRVFFIVQPGHLIRVRIVRFYSNLFILHTELKIFNFSYLPYTTILNTTDVS